MASVRSTDDVLLGCDIFDEEDITVNTRLQLEDNKWLACEVICNKQKPSKVQVSRAVTIPAYLEFIMRGHCNDTLHWEDTTYIFETMEEVKGQLFIARCVINSN